MIIYREINGQLLNPVKVQTGLDVQITGAMQLTIKVGNINGVGINADEIINIPMDNYNHRVVDIFLVKEIATGNGAIWIDIRNINKSRPPVPAGYEPVECIAWMQIPRGTTDLNTVEINVRKIL